MISNTIGSTETMTMPIVTSVKLSLMIGTLPNRHAGAHADRDPPDAADDVVEQERAGGHLRRPRHERQERADDGHEPGEDHRLASVKLEKLVGPLHVLRVDHPVGEGGAVPDPQQSRPDPPADRVVHRITKNRRGDEQHVADPRIQHAGCAQRARPRTAASRRAETA